MHVIYFFYITSKISLFQLTHFVMLKEIKQCDTIEELTVTESVKVKAKEFVRKYMSKFGAVYQRPKDDVDF